MYMYVSRCICMYVYIRMALEGMRFIILFMDIRSIGIIYVCMDEIIERMDRCMQEYMDGWMDACSVCTCI